MQRLHGNRVAEGSMQYDRKSFTQCQDFRPGVILGRERYTYAFRWMDVERRDLTQFNVYFENNRFDSI